MSEKFCVYETYKIEWPQHNYIGKSAVDRVSISGYIGSGIHLKRAVSKYGKETFDIRILAEFDTEDKAYESEVKLISEMNPYYNKSVGGKGTGSGKDHPMFGRSGENSPMFGKKRSDTAARNKKMRGEKNHMFGIDSKDHPMFGKKHKQESLRKMSNAQSGENNAMFGIKDDKHYSTKHTLDVIKETCLKAGRLNKAQKVLGYSSSGAIHKRLRQNNIKVKWDGNPLSLHSKITGFETFIGT